jgi:hypothetical protein
VEFRAGAYLARARLWQIPDEVDLLRGREWPDDFSHLQDKLLDENAVVILIVLEFSEWEKSKKTG